MLFISITGFSGVLLNVSPKEDDTAQALPGPRLPLPGTQSKTEHNISLILWSVWGLRSHCLQGKRNWAVGQCYDKQNSHVCSICCEQISTYINSFVSK